MAVEVQTEFPCQFASGDTVRVTISESEYPSSLWALSVRLVSGLAAFTFAAPAGTGGAYDLAITAAQSATIAPGKYAVYYVFTEIAVPNDRVTLDCCRSTTVLIDPAVPGDPSVARQTLTAMEAAFLLLGAGTTKEVNFNGQSFSYQNLKEFQDAINRQRTVVAAEDAGRSGCHRGGRILHPL